MTTGRINQVTIHRREQKFLAKRPPSAEGEQAFLDFASTGGTHEPDGPHGPSVKGNPVLFATSFSQLDPCTVQAYLSDSPSELKEGKKSASAKENILLLFCLYH